MRQLHAGGQAANLTNTPAAAEDWARFSPNAQPVAFHGNATGNNEIYILDLRDGALTQVTDYAGVDMWPEWSPDGQYLSFRRDMDVHKIHLRTGVITRLTNLPATLDQMAAWSPNGRQLAFMSFREGNCSVFIMNADGSDQLNLTPKRLVMRTTRGAAARRPGRRTGRSSSSRCVQARVATSRCS